MVLSGDLGSDLVCLISWDGVEVSDSRAFQQIAEHLGRPSGSVSLPTQGVRVSLADRWAAHRNAQKDTDQPEATTAKGELPPWAVGARAALVVLGLLGLWIGFAKDVMVAGYRCGSAFNDDGASLLLSGNRLWMAACDDARSDAQTLPIVLIVVAAAGLIGLNYYRSSLEIEQAGQSALDAHDAEEPQREG